MKQILSIIALVLLSACSQGRCPDPQLTRISIVDNNGMSQTVSSVDRLRRYAQADFLKPSPYQKVVRVYSRDAEGRVPLKIISYHPNGQPKQFLEARDNTAFGPYREWHDNGRLKLSAHVVGGAPDVDGGAQATWMFDGIAQAWDKEGRLIAEIPYRAGQRSGVSTYYHPNGCISHLVPYVDGLQDGAEELFSPSGSLLATTPYHDGKRHGIATKMWPNSQQAQAEETYQKGLLASAKYWDKKGNLISAVNCGRGFFAQMRLDGSLETLQEVNAGTVEGLVVLFDELGQVVQNYHTRAGVKNGIEEQFYPGAHWSFENRSVIGAPRMRLNWHDGAIQGLAQSWYENGQMESQREISNSARHGISTAWYRDGTLMLVEEYEHDRLLRGEYHRKGEGTPISEVTNGTGIATLFDDHGHFIRKIEYYQGKPQV